MSKEQTIPPGIIAFRLDMDGIVHQWNHPYDDFVRDWLYNKTVHASIHTIEVNGQRFSVGEAGYPENNKDFVRIIESFKWNEKIDRWEAVFDYSGNIIVDNLVKVDLGTYKGHVFSELPTPPSTPYIHSGGEMNKSYYDRQSRPESNEGGTKEEIYEKYFGKSATWVLDAMEEYASFKLKEQAQPDTAEVLKHFPDPVPESKQVPVTRKGEEETRPYTYKQLGDMLEDVVNELDLSEIMIEKHGPLGTAPAELVREVLKQKDLQIRLLRSGFKEAGQSQPLSQPKEGEERSYTKEEVDKIVRDWRNKDMDVWQKSIDRLDFDNQTLKSQLSGVVNALKELLRVNSGFHRPQEMIDALSKAKAALTSVTEKKDNDNNQEGQ